MIKLEELNDRENVADVPKVPLESLNCKEKIQQCQMADTGDNEQVPQKRVAIIQCSN